MMPIGREMYKPSYSPFALSSMFFERYMYVQRISMRDKPEREKERENLKRMIDATRLSIYLVNVMGHGLTSASRFLKRIQPARENECTGERRELFMKENFGSREMLVCHLISYAMS